MEDKILTHFRKDELGNVLLEFRISKLSDYYTEFDPHPLNTRDLDKKLCEHILDQLIVIPKNQKVKIVFHLPKLLKKHQLALQEAFTHHFEFDFMDSHIHLHRRLQKGRKTLLRSALIFVSFIAVSTIVKEFLPHTVFLEILSEGLFVGAWVSLWHPIEMLLFEWHPLHEDKELYTRLLNAPVEFKYY